MWCRFPGRCQLDEQMLFLYVSKIKKHKLGGVLATMKYLPCSRGTSDDGEYKSLINSVFRPDFDENYSNFSLQLLGFVCRNFFVCTSFNFAEYTFSLHILRNCINLCTSIIE